MFVRFRKGRAGICGACESARICAGVAVGPKSFGERERRVGGCGELLICVAMQFGVI